MLAIVRILVLSLLPQVHHLDCEHDKIVVIHRGDYVHVSMPINDSISYGFQAAVGSIRYQRDYVMLDRVIRVCKLTGELRILKCWTNGGVISDTVVLIGARQ